MQESVVETEVFLQYRGPTKVRYGNTRFLITGERAVGTVKRNRIRTNYGPFRHVGKTLTGVIVTNLTKRTTNLEHINNSFLF